MKKNRYILFIAFLLFGSVSNAQWERIKDFPGTPSIGKVAFSVDGKGYVCCGKQSKEVWEYNPENDTWTRKADFQSDPRAWGFAFVLNGVGYVGTGDSLGNPLNGGNETTYDMYRYNHETDTWSEQEGFAGYIRAGGFAFVIGDKAYAGTGYSSWGTPSDLWIFDPNNSALPWAPAEYYPVENSAFAVASVIGGKAYVGTGMSFPNMDVNSFFSYTPETDVWTQLADFPGGVRSGAVGFSVGKKCYIGGGLAGPWNNPTAVYNNFYGYDPFTDSWTKLENGDFPDQHSTFLTSFVIGNSVYVGAGGKYPEEEAGVTFYRYTFDTPSAVESIGVPNDISLSVYPNPVIAGTPISYDYKGNVPVIADVTIYNVYGRAVEQLNNVEMIPGIQQLRINTSLTSGLYYVTMNTPNVRKSIPLLIIE